MMRFCFSYNSHQSFCQHHSRRQILFKYPNRICNKTMDFSQRYKSNKFSRVKQSSRPYPRSSQWRSLSYQWCLSVLKLFRDPSSLQWFTSLKLWTPCSLHSSNHYVSPLVVRTLKPSKSKWYPVSPWTFSRLSASKGSRLPTSLTTFRGATTLRCCPWRESGTTKKMKTMSQSASDLMMTVLLRWTQSLGWCKPWIRRLKLGLS